MAGGESIGSVYLDFVLQDTVGKQVQKVETTKQTRS